MPFPRLCFTFSAFSSAALCRSAATAEDDDEKAGKRACASDGGSSSSCASEQPSTSTSTSSAASASSRDDSSASLATLPSLPSVQSLAPLYSFTAAAPQTAAFLCLSSFRQPSAAALAVSPSSCLLYAASEGDVLVYDLRSLRRVGAFAAAAGAGAVKSVALLPDGRVLTAHQDRRARLWRQSRPGRPHRLQAALPTAADRLRRLPLPGSYVTVRRHHRRLWIEHADAVSAVAAGSSGAIYTASWDKTFKVWRASDLRCAESVAAHDDAVNAVAVAPDGTVYTGSADRRIRVWARTATAASGGAGRHALVATLERHRSAVNALALSADGAVLYSGACDRSILVWEREDSAGHVALAGALRGHARAILSLACAGDLLFSGSADRTVRIWRRGGEGRGYSCLGVMEGHVRGVRSLVAFKIGDDDQTEKKKGGDGGEEYRVCSGSLDGEVRVWHVRLSSDFPSLVQ